MKNNDLAEKRMGVLKKIKGFGVLIFFLYLLTERCLYLIGIGESV